MHKTAAEPTGVSQQEPVVRETPGQRPRSLKPVILSPWQRTVLQIRKREGSKERDWRREAQG
ncbi:hypothetical protein ACRRTK_024516 [Alexandromys fortis]